MDASQSIRAGSRISLVWEDRGTLLKEDVTVLSTIGGMLHFIHGNKPKMVEWDRIWSYERCNPGMEATVRG